jgi:hypothetical protein
MVGNVRNSFLSIYIWHTTLTRDPIPWDLISDLSLIHFLFNDLFKFSTLMVIGIFFVTSQRDKYYLVYK